MTTSCLSTLPAPSLFSFSPEASTSLTGKINVLFGSTVACCAAGLAYVLYNFYHAYQFSMHTSFGLDDHSKLIKCKALLSEADKKVFGPKKTGEKATGLKDVLHLLQQCETMLDSLPDNFQSDKEKLLHDLVIQYAREKPEHAYSIAQHLTSSGPLLAAAEWIRKSHSNKGNLNSLYEKAYQAREREQKGVDKSLSPDCKSQGIDQDIERLLKSAKAMHTSGNINFSLKLATGFHTVGNSQRAKECFEKAQQLALTIEIPLEQMRALCEISYYLHQTQDNSSAKSSIDSATKLLCAIQEQDLIEARVVLADAHYWVKNFEKMYQELQKVIELFEANFSTCNPSLLKSLINMIRSDKKYKKHQNALSNVKFDTLIEQARPFIKSSMQKEKLETDELFKNMMDKGPTAQSGSSSQKKIPANADQKNTDAYTKVVNLVHSTSHMFGGDQIIPQLIAAEKLLPQISSSSQRSSALAEIAKGYSKVDGQKSLAILAELKNDQAKSCLIKAVVTGVGLAALRFCPLVSPVIFLGVGAYTWHTW
jgi:tetratricopeptide (TPR) repeat protein